MKNINLRNYYPDLYTSDYVIEVSDEIEELFNIDEKQEDLVPKSVEIESDSSGYSLIDYMATKPKPVSYTHLTLPTKA